MTGTQDLQDRMKKEARKEMEERTALQREEAAATREDEEYQVQNATRTVCATTCDVHHLPIVNGMGCVDWSSRIYNTSSRFLLCRRSFGLGGHQMGSNRTDYCDGCPLSRHVIRCLLIFLPCEPSVYGNHLLYFPSRPPCGVHRAHLRVFCPISRRVCACTAIPGNEVLRPLH